jgi:hypothetical protein
MQHKDISVQSKTRVLFLSQFKQVKDRILYVKININIILLSMPWSNEWHPSPTPPLQNAVCKSTFPYRYTRPQNFIIF